MLEKSKTKTSAFDRFMKKYKDGPQSLMKSKYICCFLFTIIPVIHFFVFYIGSNYYSFYLAFTELNAGKDVFSLNNFVAVFKRIANSDSSLIIALKNTGIVFIVHACQLCVNFFIAFMFARGLKGTKFFRVMLFLPTIVSDLALAVIIKNIIATDGPLSLILNQLFGYELPPLFYQPETAYATLMVYCVWGGFYQYLLIFEGSIRRVPEDVLESARLDGITPMKELFLMVIPIMWDTISTILIIMVSGLFTISAPILTFTNGQYDTQTLSFWFFQTVQGTNNTTLNVSAAVGLVITAVNLPIVFGFRKLMLKFGDSLEY